MVKSHRALKLAVQEIISRHGLHDVNSVVRLILRLCHDVVGPVLLGGLAVVVTYQALKKVERWTCPPPVRIRHEEAVEWYRSGRVREALKAFRRMEGEGHGPAVLSLAAHEIYVGGSPSEGLRLLREARVRGVKVPERPMKSMQDDARAILAGNAVMVDMSSRVAKLDYLGIATQ